ncbi:hypothetical protein Tco_0940619 [Tanacetum coccineum]|uniref:Uncharacterized protein n=1 Tax=Tanacetum coccineum TaxID=301880 RepID=A0ABQ5DUL0_9ASTR
MLTCRRTCQIRSYHQNSREAGMSKDITGDEGLRSKGTKLIQIFIKAETDDELTADEVKQVEADDQAIQTILMGLPKDIYVAVDSCNIAKEIWLRV